jgi:hypothetical protein
VTVARDTSWLVGMCTCTGQGMDDRETASGHFFVINFID